MVNENLLNESLKSLSYDRNEIKKVRYNKNIIIKLFSEYDNYKMEEESYCCHGLDKPCWIEVVEEGNWDLTLKQVKNNILKNIKECKKYLYNGKKYGSNRLHIYKNNNECYVFIYLRDVLGVDYNIWFYNEELA